MSNKNEKYEWRRNSDQSIPMPPGDYPEKRQRIDGLIDIVFVGDDKDGKQPKKDGNTTEWRLI